MMTDKDQEKTEANDLRRRAKMRIKEPGPDSCSRQSNEETQLLLQELQIHQVELEMQNTELRQARDETETVLASYTDLYDFAPVGYVTLDCFGAICSANLTATTLLRIDRTRLLGRKFDFFVSNEFRPLFSEFINQVFTSQKKESCEVALATTGKAPLFVQIEAIIATSGQECRAVIINVTERKNLEENLKSLHNDLDIHAADLAAANIELEAFNYTVSHDLRRPLAAINGYCQLLRDLCRNQLDGECLNYIQEMYKGAQRMNQLIDTLLKFSCVTRVAMSHKKINISKIAEEIARGLKAAEPERRVTLQIATDIVVTGDDGLLWALLDNLIGNAWKFTGHLKKGAVIAFGETEREGKPAYFVRDNGPGFEMELAETLFIPFQRLPGTIVEGHGIGLATVERVVKRHGGRVWAESEVGKGATFFFTLEPGPL